MDWMTSPVAPNRLEQDATTRLFFLGFMTRTERYAIISAIINQLETIVQEFEEAAIEAHKKDIPEHLKIVVEYQLKTLDMGLHSHQSMLGWFKKTLLELEEKCDD
ncbi:hypothetical protein [Caldalkalibacillus mannanilyticus]|uniref:hypothetical protein n=1 Tax=Caldalkalibacillus mannanilyticus TaxID=1418 RepID=UPI0004686416|nr:hypothetical protein [Caldalkalibacillus mannanilyticus]